MVIGEEIIKQQLMESLDEKYFMGQTPSEHQLPQPQTGRALPDLVL